MVGWGKKYVVFNTVRDFLRLFYDRLCEVCGSLRFFIPAYNC
jgi:hypothetical protein